MYISSEFTITRYKRPVPWIPTPNAQQPEQTPNLLPFQIPMSRTLVESRRKLNAFTYGFLNPIKRPQQAPVKPYRNFTKALTPQLACSLGPRHDFLPPVALTKADLEFRVVPGLLKVSLQGLAKVHSMRA